MGINCYRDVIVSNVGPNHAERSSTIGDQFIARCSNLFLDRGTNFLDTMHLVEIESKLKFDLGLFHARNV